MTTVIADVSYRFDTSQLRAAQKQIEQLDDGMRDFQREVSQSSKKVSRNMKEIEDNTNNISTGINKMSSAMKGFIALVSVGAISAVVRESISATTAFANMASLVDMSTESLSAWQYAARSVGVEGDKLTDIFKDINEKLGELSLTGGGPAKEVLDILGLSIKEIDKLNPAEKILAIARAMDSIKSQDQKIFLMETLASDASLLLPLLKDGARGYENMAREAEDLNLLISRDQVDAAKKADNELNKLSGTWDSMIRNVLTSGALDGINQGLQSINNLLTDPAAQQALRDMGNIIGETVRTIVDNKQAVLEVAAALAGAWTGVKLLGRFGPAGVIAGSLGGAAIGQSLVAEDPSDKANRLRDNRANRSREEKLLDIDTKIANVRATLEERDNVLNQRALKSLLRQRELIANHPDETITLNATTPASISPPSFTPPTPPSTNSSGRSGKTSQQLAEEKNRNIENQIKAEERLIEALERIEEDRLREQSRLINDYILTEEELITQRYERERELAEQNVYNHQQLSELKIAIAEREAEELKSIEERRAEEERTRAEERVRLIEDSSNSIFEMLSAIRDGAQVNFNGMENVMREFFKTNENGNKEWALGTEETLGFIAGATKSMAAEGTAAWKAAAATQATISAYMAINSVLGDPSIPTMARPILAGVIGGLAFANVAKIIASANGNIFDGGSVKAFATGGIVNEPTFFPMKGNQTGLMGEAGPEAIVPLRRGKGGRLGIDATGLNGGGGFSVGGVTVNVHGDAHPEKTREAVIQAMREVARKEIQNQQRTGGSLNPYQFENVVG